MSLPVFLCLLRLFYIKYPVCYTPRLLVPGSPVQQPDNYVHKKNNVETKTTNLSLCMRWTVILLLFFICLFADRSVPRQSLVQHKHIRLTELYLDQKHLVDLLA